MKNAFKPLLICWFVSGLCVAAIAEQQIIDKQPPPPPPPADDYFPKRWKEFVSQEAAFRVLLPGSPKLSTSTPQSGAPIIREFTYSGVIKHEIVLVEYPSNEDPSKAKALFDSYCDTALSVRQSEIAKIVKETDFSLGGHPGKFFQIELTGGTVVRFKFILSKNRVYILTATSRKAQPNVMGSENDYQEIAMAFLDSFQLTMP